MAKADDILNKMDALMKKHGALRGDETIPTLTEVIASGAARAGLPALSAEQVEALAIEVYQHVLQNLDARITNELQQHLKPQLARMLEQVLERMLAELKNSIKGIVDDAVSHALDAQLEHHQKLSQPSAPSTKRSSGTGTSD
jgi:hypothetical protein